MSTLSVNICVEQIHSQAHIICFLADREVAGMVVVLFHAKRLQSGQPTFNIVGYVQSFQYFKPNHDVFLTLTKWICA